MYGDEEALIETANAVAAHRLHETIAETRELAIGARFSDVGGETRTSEIQGIDEAERRRAGGAARREIAGEVAKELLFLIDAAQEETLVCVLEGEVERLRRKVAYDVREIAAPEREEALLAGNANECVDDAFVLVFDCDLRRCRLYLKGGGAPPGSR